MFNFIENYIDKKVNEKVKEREKHFERKIERLSRDKVQENIKLIIQDLLAENDRLEDPRDHEGTFRHHLPSNLRKVSKDVGSLIKGRFKYELKKIEDRQRRVDNIESKCQKIIKDKTEIYIRSEEFIDNLVDRIKRKQLN